MDKTVKFAWAYLLTYGKLTNGKWDYFSKWEDIEGTLDKITRRAISVGIDWEKSGIPEVDDKRLFDYTGGDGDKCLATLGKLVLNNGKEYLIGSSDEDAAHLAETARAILKGKDSLVLELSSKL